jgi:N-acetylmuramoyl-L-alanine amidase
MTRPSATGSDLVQHFRHGDRGFAAADLRAALRAAGMNIPDGGSANGTDGAGNTDTVFDLQMDRAVREFQQSRGLNADGVVGPDTARALDEARRRLGDRLLYYSVRYPFVGDDVSSLQHRLMNMGFDVGRCDGIYGARTEAAVQDFQRNRGLPPDGRCGPATLSELERLARTVTGGRSHELREVEALRHRGPALAGKAVVIDAGHGGDDDGWSHDGFSERTIVTDLANRLEGRLLAAGVTACLTHGPGENPDEQERAARANSLDADLLISLHVDGARTPGPQGVATFFFGSPRVGGSLIGQRFAELVQREIVIRTGLVDLGIHAKTWELLRRTKMPAVRVELGYMTNPSDAVKLSQRDFRDTAAESIMVAVQRLFLPPELDPPTGQLLLPATSALPG